MNTIRAVLVGAALLAAAWLGWNFGSGDLKKAKEELAAIDKAGKDALAKQQQVQSKLEADLAKLGKEHDERMAEINKDYDGQKRGLAADLDAARKSRAADELRRKRAEADLALVRKQLDALPAGPSAQRDALKDKEDKLVVDIQPPDTPSVIAQAASCIDTEVPAEWLARLDPKVKP